MRILITNTVLTGGSGTEVFVAQLADALRIRGHEVVLYEELTKQTAPDPSPPNRQLPPATGRLLHASQ